MDMRNMQLIERAADLQSAHDAEGLANMFVENGVFEDVPFSAVARGHEEMIRFWSDTWAAMPDFKMSLTHVFADAENGAAEWVMSATQTGSFAGLPATGKRFSLKAAAIARFADGKIVHWTDYWSLNDFRKQVGLD